MIDGVFCVYMSTTPHFHLFISEEELIVMKLCAVIRPSRHDVDQSASSAHYHDPCEEIKVQLYGAQCFWCVCERNN